MRGLAVLATGALLWGFAAGPASADNIRDGQWALQNYGAADRVWPISQGEGVIVAVIDTGVAEHQDLTGQVLPGIDIPSGNSSGRADTDGHGTGMASDIAGHGHDGQSGVMGLAPKSKILPIKIDIKGSDPERDVATAIHFAVDHGAKVINMSFAGPAAPSSGSEERAAIKYAVDKDVVLVAGAGNDRGAVEYPAAIPGVVVASGIDQQGNFWSDSSRGPQVTLAAPAAKVYHADSKSPTSYVSGDGTSDSTAYISAIAALVRSKYPELSAGQVINRMIKSAVAPPDKSAVPNDRYGYGIASPAGALKANPAVDNGPKDNPLLSRPEVNPSAGDPSTAPAATGGNNTATKSSSGSSNTMLYAIGGGVVVLVVIVLVVFLIRRSRNGGGNNGGPGAPGAPGGPGGPGGYAYPPQQQGQYYPQQQQPPAPPSGGPYQR